MTDLDFCRASLAHRATLLIAVYWHPSHGAGHACTYGGKTVVPAIVILIILAAGGGAWLGYRAGYRRGWQARDGQGPQDG